MPASYSEDFRKKVITYIERGNSCVSASIKFKIATNTVRNWHIEIEYVDKPLIT